MKAFRAMDGLTPERLTDRMVIYAYELNLLLRLAASLGIQVHIDTVDRDDATEIILRVADHDTG